MITTYILGLREASKQGLDTSSGPHRGSSLTHQHLWLTTDHDSWPNSGDFIGGPHRGSSLTHRHPWLDITQVHGCDLTETLHRGRFWAVKPPICGSSGFRVLARRLMICVGIRGSSIQLGRLWILFYMVVLATRPQHHNLSIWNPSVYRVERCFCIAIFIYICIYKCIAYSICTYIYIYKNTHICI